MDSDSIGSPRNECTLIIDSDGLDTFHRFIASSWERLQRQTPVEPEWEFECVTLLGELVANVVQHAYMDAPESHRWLQVRLDLLPSCMRGELRDRGKPFENAQERLRAVSGQQDSVDEESGRGLRILSQLADSIEYDRTESGENIWRVTKCLRPPGDLSRVVPSPAGAG